MTDRPLGAVPLGWRGQFWVTLAFTLLLVAIGVESYVDGRGLSVVAIVFAPMSVLFWIRLWFAWTKARRSAQGS